MDIFKKLYSKFVGFVVIFLLLIAVNSFVGLFNKPEISENQVVETEIAVDSEQEDELIESITYEPEEEGQNAFELLKKVAEVEYKEYDFGVFVESINGTKGDDKNFWAFYLNDEKSQVGADHVSLTKGDLVEWRYEAIE